MEASSSLSQNASQWLSWAWDAKPRILSPLFHSWTPQEWRSQAEEATLTIPWLPDQRRCTPSSKAGIPSSGYDRPGKFASLLPQLASLFPVMSSLFHGWPLQGHTGPGFLG